MSNRNPTKQSLVLGGILPIGVIIGMLVGYYHPAYGSATGINVLIGGMFGLPLGLLLIFSGTRWQQCLIESCLIMLKEVAHAAMDDSA